MQRGHGDTGRDATDDPQSAQSVPERCRRSSGHSDDTRDEGIFDGDGDGDTSLFASDTDSLFEDDTDSLLAGGSEPADAPIGPVGPRPMRPLPLPPPAVDAAAYITWLPDVGTVRNSRRAGILVAARVPTELHVANVFASSAGGDRRPPGGLATWKRFWKHAMRGTTHVWPAQCQIGGADAFGELLRNSGRGRASVGGHMYVREVPGYAWNFILPICSWHNNQKRNDCSLHNCALNAYTLAGLQFSAYLPLRPSAVFAVVDQRASVTAFQEAALARVARMPRNSRR